MTIHNKGNKTMADVIYLTRRDETPEQRTERLLHTDPAFLDTIAFNLFENHRYQHADLASIESEWQDMSDAERQGWRDRVLAGYAKWRQMTPEEQEQVNRESLAETMRINGERADLAVALSLSELIPVAEA